MRALPRPLTLLLLLLPALQAPPAAADWAADRRALLQEHARLLANPAERVLPVPDGRVLHPGEHGQFVAQLRAALAAYGYPSGAASGSDPLSYDPALVESVERYQTDVGLVPDGVVGGETRLALRAMDNDRVRMIEQSLARPDPPSHGRYLWVNLAAGSVTGFDEGVETVTSRVVIGNKDNPTPTFSARIDAVWVNPSWVVPDSIVIKEFGGRAHIEKPGPNNPLGQLLLELPNRYEVFLHSTNQPSLFERDVRAFSHGCVRVKEVKAVARWLLGDERWETEGVETYLAGLSTHRIPIDPTVAIYIDYRTATIGPTGAVIYHPDPYGLAAPPPPEPPSDAPPAVTAGQTAAIPAASAN